MAATDFVAGAPLLQDIVAGLLSGHGRIQDG